MGSPIQVTPETLTGAATDLTAIAAQMMTGLQALQATVTGSGNPWGGDEQGTIFAGIYGRVLGSAMEGIASHINQVDYAATGLKYTADQYSGADETVATGNNALRTAIG